MNKIKLYFSVFLALVITLPCFSQDYSTIHPSGNIGWSLASVNQQNELFAGKTNISIPIYEMELGSMKLPISLTYKTKSIEVDQVPSWAGLGWNLNIGGQITRLVNGRPDEMRSTKNFWSRATILTSYGSSTSSVTNYSILTQNDFAYITNKSQLTSQWSNPAYLQNTLAALPFIEVSMNEITTWMDFPPYQTQTFSPTYDYRHHYDFEPDEFHFSIGAINGTFYLANDNTWKCETNQGNFKVESFIVIDAPKGEGGRKVPRAYNKFILTGPDGIKYTFGSTDPTNHFKNNEFWRGPAPVNYGEDFANYFNGNYSQYVNFCPSAWQITKIETPENSYVDFEYKQAGVQVNYADAPRGIGGSSGLTRNYPGSINQSLSEPYYLTSIKASNGTTIEVGSSLSQQLGSNKRIDNLSNFSTFLINTEIYTQVFNQTNNLLKVNDICIKDGNVVKKKFQFNYIENLNERLKLKYFKQVVDEGSQVNKIYEFIYHQGSLPDYGSGKVDHFGFFNNRRYFTDNVQTSFPANFPNEYYNSREPEYEYSKYEILNKVIFPTGGFREFTFEQNDYKKAISRWPFSTTSVSSNTLTGGIRIAKIIDFTSLGVKASEIEFIYKTDINGTESSGVYSILPPQYFSYSSPTVYSFETRSFVPFDRIKDHVTYSTVYEKFLDGSYKKNVFWNHDNGAEDQPPAFDTPSPAYENKQEYTNNHFKRGHLKYSEEFNNLSQSLVRNNYKLQHEFDDYTRYIRSVRITHNNSQNTGYRSAAYPIFYFPNLIREKSVVTASTYDLNSKVSVKENYDYDAENNLVTLATTNSMGSQGLKKMRYPYHFITSDPLNPYLQMTERGIKNKIIEEQNILVKSGQNYITGGKLNIYNIFPLSLLKIQYQHSLSLQQPQLATSLLSTSYNNSTHTLSIDPAYQFSKTTMSNYNILGEPQEIVGANGIKEVILYGYKGRYIVAKISGVSLATISSLFNQSVLDNPLNDEQLRTQINQIRTNLTNTSAQVTSFTYNPLIGMTSSTDVNNKTTYYEYDDFGRLTLTLDQNKKIIKKICYNYAGQAEDCFIRAVVKANNQTTTPYTLTLMNTATNSSNSYSIYPSSQIQQIANLSGGSYSGTITPMYPPGSTNILKYNGTQQTNNTFMLAPFTLSGEVLFELSTPPSQNTNCYFSMQSGFSNPSSGMSASGNTVSFYLILYANAALNAGTTYDIATISGCRPSQTRSVGFTSNGRYCTISFSPTGNVSFSFVGSNFPAYSTISATSLTYPL